MKHINKLSRVCMAAIIVASLTTSVFSQEQKIEDHHDAKMDWFQDAKLGIFIHWGIYAVDGIDESWSFYNKYISFENYMKQVDGFTAEHYDAEAWADLIEESGAQYSVITTKHHDGFALWDSKHRDLNAIDAAPSGKDVLTPFVDALRKRNLKVGLYYSLSDWSHPDYTHFLRDSMRYKAEDDPARWNTFLQYCHGHIEELTSTYKPDLIWFDGDWEHSAKEWQSPKVRKLILDNNPNTIINSRLQGYGDYGTPEQGVPITAPEDKYWELCMTMNDSWGYQRNDHNYKSTGQLIEIFTDVLSLGGNLLLDIGPMADGSIPEPQEKTLKELGAWTSKHKEAIYGTRAGIDKKYYYGSSTLSKDKKTLYLFVKGNPGEEITVRGLKNKINRIYVVGKGTKLTHKKVGSVYWSEYPGITYIPIPDYVLDDQMTVLAIMLDGEVDMF